METRLILDFLRELEQNNNLNWMHAHKPDYNEAKACFEQLLQELIDGLAVFDASVVGLNPKDLVFRLNRDTRFSKDKSPYNPSFRAHISSAGRQPIPAGYYISVKPGNCFLGGGVFAACLPGATAMVRDCLAADPAGFERVIVEDDFKANFTVSGEKLKNVPRGYDKAYPLAEYLKHKSWDIEYHLSDGEFCDAANNLPLMLAKFRLMQPFNNYLNMALRDFKLPKRP